MGLTRQTKKEVNTSNGKVMEISRKLCLHSSNSRKSKCGKINNI